MIVATCGGCITARGMLDALATDLALVSAAGAQGFLAGIFDQTQPP